MQSQQLVNTIQSTSHTTTKVQYCTILTNKTTIVFNNISYIGKYLKCVEKLCKHIPHYCSISVAVPVVAKVFEKMVATQFNS